MGAPAPALGAGPPAPLLQAYAHRQMALCLTALARPLIESSVSECSGPSTRRPNSNSRDQSVSADSSYLALVVISRHPTHKIGLGHLLELRSHLACVRHVKLNSLVQPRVRRCFGDLRPSPSTAAARSACARSGVDLLIEAHCPRHQRMHGARSCFSPAISANDADVTCLNAKLARSFRIFMIQLVSFLEDCANERP